jgi:DNA-binding LytR/AlgR family response regulator
MLQKHFSDHNRPLEKFINQLDNRKKSRLIVKKGLEFIALKLEDIVLLYTENKLVYVIDRYGKKYVGDKTLSEMEMELDESSFFRANRQYIININFIKGFKPFDKVKLLIELSIPELRHEIIVSQENAPHFKEWIYEA